MEFNVYQRNDLLIPTTLNEDGEPFNLEGTDVYFLVGDWMSKSLDDGIVITDVSNGEIEIAITHEDTDVEIGPYTYELVIVDVEGRQYTVGRGIFRVKESNLKGSEVIDSYNG